jgi:hypothetical protein
VLWDDDKAEWGVALELAGVLALALALCEWPKP